MRAVPRGAGGRLALVDIGATVDTSPAQLAQFAVMGHVFAKAVLGVASPRVGLLSNGGERGKGNEAVKAADRALDGLPIDYAGPMEPTTAFRGGCDVLVCDGFVGNVLLKTSEGLAAMLSQFIKQEFTRNAYSKFAALIALPVPHHFKRRVDHGRHNGAALLGCRVLAFNSHGSASPTTL